MSDPQQHPAPVGHARPRAAVFLDRDDTLVVNRAVTASTAHPGDLADPTLIRLIPGVADGLQALAQAGLALVVVSNQGVVARSNAALSRVEACHRRLRELIEASGGPTLDGCYACPYHPTGRSRAWAREHAWRKPSPGMFFAAAADLQLQLAQCWMIGDADRDAQAAISAGVPAEHVLLVDVPGQDGARPHAHRPIAPGRTFQQAAAEIAAAHARLRSHR